MNYLTPSKVTIYNGIMMLADNSISKCSRDIKSQLGISTKHKNARQ
jgi:hypothetical protein